MENSCNRKDKGNRIYDTIEQIVRTNESAFCLADEEI